MIRNKKNLHEKHPETWRSSEDRVSAPYDLHHGRAEEIVMKVAAETAETIRAIFAGKTEVG